MNEYITLPKCPVCMNHYSKTVKPMILQPCSHGMCESCILKYRELEDEDIKCPKCREVIIEEKPNFDLIELIPEGPDQHYWSQKLVETCDRIGIAITVHEKVEVFSKVIVKRIVHDTRIQTMGLTEWTTNDKKVIHDIIQGLRDCILILDIDFEEATKWIQVLSFPKPLERYFTSHVLTLFESKKFLEPMNAEWLLDLIPTPV